MTQILATQADLDNAITALIAADERFGAMLAATGSPALRRRETGFAGLSAIIVSQQLSTQSAAAIWGRLAGAFDPFHPETLRKSRADRLARLGLSAAKIKTLKGIARAVTAGDIDLAALAQHDAEAAHAALTALHGVGPWTADIYLLFCLGHSDAWPAGDLALQEAIRLGFGLRSRPTVKDMARLSETWRPWRGAAAHLLWAYYKVAKTPGFDALPAAPKAAPRKKKPTR
jgi:DNA-3-methyladenine glycosylase II